VGRDSTLTYNHCYMYSRPTCTLDLRRLAPSVLIVLEKWLFASQTSTMAWFHSAFNERRLQRFLHSGQLDAHSLKHDERPAVKSVPA
jgi:hypothetical protein